MKLGLCLEDHHKYRPSKKKGKGKSGAVMEMIECIYFINTYRMVTET